MPVTIAIDNWDPIRLPWGHSPYTVQIAPGVHHASLKVGAVAPYSKPVRFVVADVSRATLSIYGSSAGFWRTATPRLVVDDGPPKAQAWPQPQWVVLLGSALAFVVAMVAVVVMTPDSGPRAFLPWSAGVVAAISGAAFAEHFMRTSETTYAEAGRPLERPITRVAAAAVVTNEYAGQWRDDLSPMYDAAAEVAADLAQRAVAALPGEPESYGKAAIVGLDGELEHAAAVLHPSLGKPLRDAVGGGTSIIPSAKKAGTVGTTIDVPLHYKDAAFVRTHFDAMEVRVPDAPRPDELVIVVAVTDGGRPHPRVGGLTIDEAEGADGLR